MGPAIIGRKGAGVTTLEAALPKGCTVKVLFDSEEARGTNGGQQHRGQQQQQQHQAQQQLAPGQQPCVSVVAPDPATLADALPHVHALIASLSLLRVHLSVPQAAFGALIGKGGSAIKALQVGI